MAEVFNGKSGLRILSGWSDLFLRSAFLGLLLALNPALAQSTEIVITFGGDVNFARSRQSPSSDHVQKFGTHSLKDVTENIADFWDGDVNFVNVETVVAAQDQAKNSVKKFVFRSHPEQFDYLVELGVNAFSLANNHAYDHGRAGMEKTLAYFSEVRRDGASIVFAGVGVGESAFKPDIASFRGIKVALSAMTFSANTWAPRTDKMGLPTIGNPAHVDKVIQQMSAADADIKILSIHYGTENYVGLNAGQQKLYNQIAKDAGIHLILGHHPHVVRPIELLEDETGAIFYSLGNLLFIGGANKDRHGAGLDFGILGKAYFTILGSGPKLSALQISPLKGVHLKPWPLAPNPASAALKRLNKLSVQQVGKTAVSFKSHPSGSPAGLACFGNFGLRAKKLCCRISDDFVCNLPNLM